MSNLFYDLPEDIQLKIIMMNPHPAAELMKGLYEFIEDIELIDFVDLNTNQRRVSDNMDGWSTIIMYDYVHTNNKCILFQGGNLYTICEGERIIIKEF